MARPLPVVSACVALSALAPAGCNRKPVPVPLFQIIVHVWSEPGRPLPGAIVMRGSQEGPSTGAEGKASVKLGGQEGDAVDLMIKCPVDYVSPTHAITVVLRRDAGRIPEYEATCPPDVHRLVVAVRADNGPNLPVKVQDRVVGYTDANGAFTYMMPLKAGDGVEMMIDTSGNPRISPKNPTTVLTMKSYDDVLTFDEKFQVAEVKPVAKPKPVFMPVRPRRGVF